MDVLSWVFLVLIILLIFFSSFFSAFETALGTLNQFKLRVRADDGDRRAKRVLRIYKDFDKGLIASLIGNNIVAVLISTLATAFLFERTGIADDAVSAIATAVMTIIVYIFGDTIPKLVARDHPERVALNSIDGFLFFYYLFYPLVLLFSGMTSLVNLLTHVKERPTLTEEDFVNVVETIGEDDRSGNNDAELIQHSLEFSDTSVRDVLTPRDKMYCIDLKGTSRERINELILKTDYSRIPVSYGSIDRIVGVLHVKNYIRAYLKNPGLNPVSALQKPYFVSPRIKIDDMIEGFRKHKTHIAIVRSGETVLGMVTMEDVLEELVGDIGEVTTARKGSA